MPIQGLIPALLHSSLLTHCDNGGGSTFFNKVGIAVGTEAAVGLQRVPGVSRRSQGRERDQPQFSERDRARAACNAASSSML